MAQAFDSWRYLRHRWKRAFIVLLLLPRFTIVFILLEDLHGSGARLLKQCRQPQRLQLELVNQEIPRRR